MFVPRDLMVHEKFAHEECVISSHCVRLVCDLHGRSCVSIWREALRDPRLVFYYSGSQSGGNLRHAGRGFRLLDWFLFGNKGQHYLRCTLFFWS